MRSLSDIKLDRSLHFFHIFPIDLPCILSVYNSLLFHNGRNIRLRQTFDQVWTIPEIGKKFYLIFCLSITCFIGFVPLGVIKLVPSVLRFLCITLYCSLYLPMMRMDHTISNLSIAFVDTQTVCGAQKW